MASEEEIISELVTTYKDLGSEELEGTLHALAREFDDLRDHAESLQTVLNDPQFANSPGLKDLEKELKEVQGEMRSTASEIRKAHSALEDIEEEAGKSFERMGHQLHQLSSLVGLHFGVQMIHHVERFVEESVKLAEKNREEWGQAADALSEDFKRSQESTEGLKGAFGELALTFKEGLAFQGLNRTTEELQKQNAELIQWQKTAAGISVIIGDWRTGFQGIAQGFMKDFRESLDKDDPIRQFLDNMSTEAADALEKRFMEAQGIVQDRADAREAAKNRPFDPAAEEFGDPEELKAMEKFRKEEERFDQQWRKRVDEANMREAEEAERQVEAEKKLQKRIDDERAQLRDRAWFEELNARKKIKEKQEEEDGPFQAHIESLTSLSNRVSAGAASARQDSPAEKAAAAAEKTAKAMEEQNKVVEKAFDVPLSTIKHGLDNLDTRVRLA